MYGIDCPFCGTSMDDESDCPCCPAYYKCPKCGATVNGGCD